MIINNSNLFNMTVAWAVEYQRSHVYTVKPLTRVMPGEVSFLISQPRAQIFSMLTVILSMSHEQAAWLQALGVDQVKLLSSEVSLPASQIEARRLQTWHSIPELDKLPVYAPGSRVGQNKSPILDVSLSKYLSLPLIK